MAGNSSTVRRVNRELNAPTFSSQRSRRLAALLQVMLFVLDGSALVLAFLVAYWGRTNLPFLPVPDGQPALASYVPTLVFHVTLTMLILYFSRMYHERRLVSRIDRARNIIATVTLGSLLAYSLQDLVFRGTVLEVFYPRSLFSYAWFFSILFVWIGRETHNSIKATLRSRGVLVDNLLIIGSGGIARDIIGKIRQQPILGYNMVGVVNGEGEHKGRMLGVPVIGSYPQLPELIDRYEVAQVIIALPEAKRAELVDLVTLCQRGQVDIKLYPDIFAYMAGDLNVDDLGGTPLLTVRDIALRGWRLSLKRGLDVFGAVVGLIFLSPLMLLTALLIRLESPGSIFYTQVRMGMDGRPFPMIKFRSMRPDAETAGPGWTVEGDPRVTRIGAFMRKTNWDEIPQLINVLFGHMSLVGPRPERPVYVQEFRQQIPRYMERHREKAGMTGWAQVNGLRGDTSIAERTAYDLWYVENWSLWLDIKIILRTLWQTVSRSSKNAY